MMTPQGSQADAQIGDFFWIKWVLANAVGFGVAAAVSFAPIGVNAWSRVAAAREGAAGIVSGIFVWGSPILAAVAIGGAQWSFLRRQVHWANSWFLGTSLGWLVSYFVVQNLVVVLPIDSRWPYGSAAIDIVPIIFAALPQWLILRRHLSGAGWWVVASIAGAAGGFVGYLVGSFGMLIVAFFLARFIDELWFSAVLLGLLWGTMGAAISAFTGVALRQLLKRPIPETLIPPASTIRAD